MDLAATWERRAQDWITWARAPGHDAFWHTTWPSLRTVLPAPNGPVLDVGCGEGRLARELLRLGHPVVGVDRSPTLVRAASTASPRVPVVLADAAALPFTDRCAALVVACMSLHDVDNFAGAVGEIARVLRDDGQLCVALIHPFVTAEDEDTVHTETFRVSRPYLQPRGYEYRVQRAGMSMTFASVHRPLGAYTATLSANGLAVTELTETGDGPVPWLLVLRARRCP